MNKSNILFLLHLPPPLHGASSVGTQLKNCDLIKSRFNATFFNISTSKSLNNYKFFSFFIFLKKLIYILRLTYKTKPDLIYYTITSKGIAFLKDFITLYLIKSNKRKIVLHFHNKGVSSNKNYIFHIMYKYIFENFHIILLSKRLFYDIKKYKLKKSISFCSNGLSFKHFNNSSKPISNSKFDFLFLSNLIKEKGVIDFVKACNELKKQVGSGFSAAIVGNAADVSFEELKMSILNYDLCENIKVLGPLFGVEKMNVFNNSKIFVFPTFYHYECFPLVILEAMFFKMPIISTSEGAIKDLLIDNYNGLITNKNDYMQLCSKMRSLLNDSKKQEIMSKNSYNHYVNNFTEKHFYNNILSIINKILNYEKSIPNNKKIFR